MHPHALGGPLVNPAAFLCQCNRMQTGNSPLLALHGILSLAHWVRRHLGGQVLLRCRDTLLAVTLLLTLCVSASRRAVALPAYGQWETDGRKVTCWNTFAMFQGQGASQQINQARKPDFDLSLSKLQYMPCITSPKHSC